MSMNESLDFTSVSRAKHTPAHREQEREDIKRLTEEWVKENGEIVTMPIVSGRQDDIRKKKDHLPVVLPE